MIKLVENNKEAALVLEHLKIDRAPLLAAKMFTEGFGVKQDFLQFYAAFNNYAKLCAAFVKCNDRLFCLIENLYDVDEIKFFIKGFEDFKIFISSKFAHIIDRKNHNCCLLMKKQGTDSLKNENVIELESKRFSEIIMQGKDKEAKIRFLLNNSHLLRHGYLKNYALNNENNILSIASLYNDNQESYLCNVFTPLEYRHKGFSTILINSITNSEECHLICSDDVSKLYIKCGFTSYAKWIEYLY